jgi:hypothetical protein
MSVQPATSGTVEFAVRVSLSHGTGAWLVLLAPAIQHVDWLCSDLAQAMRMTSDIPVQLLRAPRAATDIAETARTRPADALVVGGLDDFTEADWRHLDEARSRLQRTGSVVLVLTPAAAGSLERSAPHLASWLGASARSWDPSTEELSPAQRTERIATLERWSGKKSAEIVKLAEEGRLPPDPEYREWLVLIGRGDLVAA